MACTFNYTTILSKLNGGLLKVTGSLEHGKVVISVFSLYQERFWVVIPKHPHYAARNCIKYYNQALSDSHNI